MTSYDVNISKKPCGKVGSTKDFTDLIQMYVDSSSARKEMIIASIKRNEEKTKVSSK